MSLPRQQILDALSHARARQQVVLHRVESARADAVAVLDALAVIEATLRPPSADAGRVLDDLGAAAIRAGLTLNAVAHLTCIAPERVLQIAEGAQPTGSERRSLANILADWDGGSRS